MIGIFRVDINLMQLLIVLLLLLEYQCVQDPWVTIDHSIVRDGLLTEMPTRGRTLIFLKLYLYLVK